MYRDRQQFAQPVSSSRTSAIIPPNQFHGGIDPLLGVHGGGNNPLPVADRPTNTRLGDLPTGIPQHSAGQQHTMNMQPSPQPTQRQQQQLPTSAGGVRYLPRQRPATRSNPQQRQQQYPSRSYTMPLQQHPPQQPHQQQQQQQQRPLQNPQNHTSSVSGNGVPRPQPSLAPLVNPFDVLGIPKNTTDEGTVNRAYQKLVAHTHPDRGGDPRQFQQVAAAYKAVIEVLQQHQREAFGALKSRAQYDIGQQFTEMPAGMMIGQGDKAQFNVQRFNTVFGDNRVWDPSDDGYGEVMDGGLVDSYAQGIGDTVQLDDLIRRRQNEDMNVTIQQGTEGLRGDGTGKGFNPSSFNTAFMSGARNRVGKSMIRREEPEVAEFFKTSTSNCTALSYDKIDDYSSAFAAGGTVYTDYMKAFSEDSLITPQVADLQIKQKSIDQLKAERLGMSFAPDPELVRQEKLREMGAKERDEKRWRDFLRYQETIEAQHKAVSNLLDDGR